MNILDAHERRSPAVEDAGNGVYLMAVSDRVGVGCGTRQAGHFA
jgi:hypothetical protein